MPCRSPPPLASQPYLSMAQQSNGIGVPPPTQPKKQSAGMPVQPSSGQPATNNAVPARNGYNERAMAEIKNSLSNYEKVNGLHRPIRPVSALSTGSSTNSAYSSDYVQCLALNGGLVLDEETNNRIMAAAQYGNTSDLTGLRSQLSISRNGHPNGTLHAPAHVLHRASPALNVRSDSPNIISGGGAPPALPPRSHQIEPPRVPPSMDAPPPPPPRRSTNNANPPPTPPRGTTPPPPNSSMYSNSPITTSIPPPLLKRMSPVPTHASRATGIAVSHSQRGTSPVTTSHPMKVHNTREMQQAVQQQLQMHQATSHIFPEDGKPLEPPPPYPMGSAASNTQHTPSLNANPPPSYSQSFAIQRQSPTLSSTSSEYQVMTSANFRRSPAPINNHMMTGMAAVYQHTYNGHAGHGPSPIPASPSPSATSMMSGSSRTSSTLQAWSARPVTQSPVIMQKVQSVQVQKPRLQTAKPIAPVPTPTSAAPSSAPILPPPSYEKSLQENCPSPVINQVPPPPPYPSTAVASSKELAVNPGVNQQVISTAKVVNNKPVLQRKCSPMVSEASSTSRSESPISDSQQTISSENTVSCSPSSFNDITDSGIENANRNKKESTTHISSPKPERRQISPAKEETRKSIIKECPPQAFKFYMESHIGAVWHEFEERKKRRNELNDAIANSQGKLFNQSVEDFVNKLNQFESNYLRMKRAKLTIKDFDIIKRIGVGGFGEVNLVRRKTTGPMGGPTHGRNNIFAMKTLKKSIVMMRKQVAHVIAERDILSKANNEWIVKLHYSFQDKNNLYFIMEYVPGGDLMSLLIKEDKFTEDRARFYTYELACAVQSVHDMDFIHRDIKPDNILIDARGHLKLTDFGLCTGFHWRHDSKQYDHGILESAHIRQDSMDPKSLNLDEGQCSCQQYANGMKPLDRRARKKRCMAHSLVGTNNYIAPEILMAKPPNHLPYTNSCDWWSVGVVLYEMIIGRPPFHVHAPHNTDRDNMFATQAKILNHKETLDIPVNEISREAASLIRGLICDASERLTADQISNHSFFNKIPKEKNIRELEAEWKPKLDNEEDTQNFDFPENEHLSQVPNFESNDQGGDSNANQFYGFTFRRFFTNGGPTPDFFQGNSSSNNQNSINRPGTGNNHTNAGSNTSNHSSSTAISTPPNNSINSDSAVYV